MRVRSLRLTVLQVRDNQRERERVREPEHSAQLRRGRNNREIENGF